VGDPTDQAAMKIIAEVLALAGHTAPVAATDDLYDLGFDSLRIMQLAARVTERLGVEAPLAAYFDAGTVADLVTLIATASAAPSASTVEAKA
jgi:acyl carrier protein